MNEGNPYNQPSSHVQIKELNDQRPKPELTYVPTPTGPLWQEVYKQEAIKKNHEIDNRIARMQKRLSEKRGAAKRDFNRSRGA